MRPDATIALILAGGRGQRLWPLSTAACPKPFRALFGAEPPVTRVVRQAAAWLGDPSSVWLSLGDAQLAAAREAVPELERYTLFLEPRPAETTAAIARAALAIAARRPDAVLVILAADQRMGPDDAVLHTLERAASIARGGPFLVSVGVAPEHPSPAYGYMRKGAPIGGDDDAWEGLGYVEKPDVETATRLLAEGRCLWNVGMFAFRVDTLLAALGRHQPEAMAALAAGREPAPALRAIDYALLERVRPDDPERHAFVEARCSFRDCGNLEALAAEALPDAHGNRVLGAVSVELSADCVLLCEAPRRIEVSGLTGMLVAVGAEGNVLVSPRATRDDGRRAKPAMELRSCVDEEEAGVQAADLVVKILAGALARRGRAVIVPSTGRTVLRCYALLAAFHRSAIDWDRVEVFQMDELSGVPEALTAQRFLTERLLTPLGIRRACLMRDATLAEAQRVERELIGAGADLMLHGLGENGHLGLNEPGSAFDCGAREVALDDDTRRSKRGQFGETPPARGATLGLAALLGAPRTLVLATGAHKRRALERALFAPRSEALPASGLQLRDGVTVIADAEALPLR